MQVYFQVGMIKGDTEQQNKQYVAFMEELAYIGSTWVETAVWPVMMQTILILNVQEKNMWRKLAGLKAEKGDDNIRAEWECYAMHTGSLQR